VISGDEFGQHPASRNLVVRLTFIYAARSIVIIRWSPCRPEPGRSQSTQHSSGLWPGLSCHGNISRKSSLDWGFYHSPTLRRPNAELRTREYLTAAEIESLIEAAKGNRHSHQDATMFLLAFRHGLRAAEACDLRWDQVDFNGAVLHVRGVKNTASTHPLRGDELRALRRLHWRARRRRLSSSASGDPRSRPLALPGWSSGRRLPPALK
jgi:integrase